MKNKHIKFFLNFLILISNLCFSQKIIDLNKIDKQHFINPDEILIFYDGTNKLTIQEISNKNFNKFKTATADNLYAENFGKNYWLKIRIKGSKNQFNKWVIEGYATNTGKSVFYNPIDQQHFKLDSVGIYMPFKHRKYKIKNLLFDLNLADDSVYTCYFRINSEHQPGFEYMIRKQEYSMYYAVNEYAYLGAYYGILLVVAIFFLALFFNKTQLIYFSFVVYIVTCILTSMCEDGSAFELLLPNFPKFYAYIFGYIDFPLLLISYTFYTTTFINLKKHDKKLFQYIWLIVGLYLIVEYLGLLYGHLMLVYILPYLFILYSTIQIYKKHHSINFYLILGQLFLIISLTLTRLAWLDIIPSNMFTVYSFNFSVLLDSTLFSIAFLSRFSNINKERLEAKEEIVKHLKEKEQIQDKVARELEQKVEERTLLLKEEKLKLADANEKLEILMSQINEMNSKLDLDNWKLNKQVIEEKKARIVLKDVDFDSFKQIYPSDAACIKYLMELKWQSGYECKKCNNTKCIDMDNAKRCTKCAYIESATNSTIFHGIKFPIQKAFYMVYLVALNQKAYTLDELSVMLNLRRNTCSNFKNKVSEKYNQIPKSKWNKEKNKLDVLILD